MSPWHRTIQTVNRQQKFDRTENSFDTIQAKSDEKRIKISMGLIKLIKNPHSFVFLLFKLNPVNDAKTMQKCLFVKQKSNF